MATLEETVYNAEYPQPASNETLESYAKRMALIGAHIGVGWSMTHTPPAVLFYTAPQDEGAPGLDDLPDA